MRRLFAALIVTSPPSPRSARRTPPTRASKIKETGKKAARKLTCWSGRWRAGTYAACAAKADTRFAAKFAHADARGKVPRRVTPARRGEGGQIADDVVGALTGSPRPDHRDQRGATCASSKLKGCARLPN